MTTTGGLCQLYSQLKIVKTVKEGAYQKDVTSTS